MFRAKLRQTLSQTANSFLDFVTPAAPYSAQSRIPILVHSDPVETTTALIKRRRRARNLAGHEAASLRSTWF